MKIFRENRGFLKTVTFLALPIVMQELLNSGVNMLDTLMIGTLGLEEITAVGLANQVFFLFILLLFGINSGSSVFMGQFWGKKDIPSLHKTMGICFLLGLIGACFFAVVAFLIPHQFMRLYSDGNPKVIELGINYLRIVGISYLLTPFSMTINSSLRSVGETRLPMVTTTIALVVNAILNYVFIFILGKGVEGAATATVIARVCEVGAQFILLRKLKMPVLGSLRGYFGFSPVFIKEFLKVTFPVIMNELTWAIGTSLYNVAYRYTGTEGQGAIQITGTIANLFSVLGISVGSAGVIMLSNTLGAGETDKAISYSRKLIGLSALLSFVMSIFMVFFSPAFLSLFNVSDVVVGYCTVILYITAGILVIRILNYVFIVGILRSGGDTLFCLLLDGGAVWLVGVPLAFFGAKVLGLPVYWVFLMGSCEELAKFVIGGYRVLTNKWAKSIVENL